MTVSSPGGSGGNGRFIDVAKLRVDLAKFDGKPPYDTPSNLLRGDGYFGQWIERTYGSSIPELRDLLREADGLAAIAKTNKPKFVASLHSSSGSGPTDPVATRRVDEQRLSAAIAAMQSLIILKGKNENQPYTVAVNAVEYADALIEELRNE